MKLILQATKQEAGEARTFVWTPDTHVPYKAGQHVSVMLVHDNPDIRGKVRTFTLSSSPTEEGIYQITTKLGPSSFKQALFSLPIGSNLEARAPSGSIILDEADTRLRVMIAGGIGITPFRSMIKYAADKNLSLPITLLYSNKIPEEIVFRKELEEIGQSHPSIKILFTVTRPEEGKEQWSGRVGRVDEEMVRQFAPDPANTLFYIAGPSVMVEAMLELLQNMAVPKENILFEKFSGY